MYYKYSQALKDKYNFKVYKLPVALPLSCPVRDGTKGNLGCIFCGADSAGYETHSSDVDISMQIKRNAEYISKKYNADKYEIYFQNFTNTYVSASQFADWVNEALNSQDGIVVLSISTRPDCLTEKHLDILKEASIRKNVDVCIELGLQSVNNNTLKILNRSHTLAHYISAVQVIKKYGFSVCTHIITTLPWDMYEDVMLAADIISALDTDSVKLHTLYIEKNTLLSKMYEEGKIKLLGIGDYIERTIGFLERLSPLISVQRLNARVPEELSVFCNWSKSHWVLTEMVENEMQKRRTYQGRCCDYKYDSAMERFK